MLAWAIIGKSVIVIFVTVQPPPKPRPTCAQNGNDGVLMLFGCTCASPQYANQKKAIGVRGYATKI
jgi:hypothetical protein